MPVSPIDFFFLQQGVPGQAEAVAARLVAFIGAARASLDIAIYDFRLRDPALAQPVLAALRERAKDGVVVRLAYDPGPLAPAEAPAATATLGVDPPTLGTVAFLAQLDGSGVQCRPIRAAPQLLHHKYLIRDGHSPTASLWTGSANFTDDTWRLQENNIVTIASPALCALYATDFGELWQTGTIFTSGTNDNGTAQVGAIRVDAAFSPGDGPRITHFLADLITNAQRRVRVASMILSSGSVLAALAGVLERGRVHVSGVHDATQMAGVLHQWQQQGERLQGKTDLFHRVAPALAGKHSTPYAPNTPHDFMHNKLLVVDDVVVTGSFNFSSNAARNAENQLAIHDPALADEVTAYIDGLTQRYGGAGAPVTGIG